MKTFRQEACNVYLWAMLLVIPVIVQNKYQNITGIKESFFIAVAVIFIICNMIAIIGKHISDRNMGIEIPGLRDQLKSMSMLDWCMFAFGLIAFISSLTTRYGLRHALLADVALFVGGITIFFLSLAFLMFSRGAEAARMSYIYGFWFSSFVVVGVGFLNHLRIDPLGIHQGNVADTIGFMSSTIGNVDYFYGYLAVVMMFFATYRASIKQRWQKIMTDILMIICYLTTWTASADGVFSGVSFGLVIFVYVGMLSYVHLKNMFWQGILAGVAGAMAEWICRKDEVFADGIRNSMSGLLLFRHLWVVLGVLCLAVWFAIVQFEKNEERKQKAESILFTIRKIYVFFAVVLLVGATVLVIFTPVGELSQRTFIWNEIKQMFPRGTIREKLIGVGPGCLDLARKKLGMFEETGVASMRYETAHNELYEYFFELGILGVAFYIGVVVSFFATFFRSTLLERAFGDMTSEPEKGGASYGHEMACCAVLFAAYLGQGMTNGPNPVPTIVAFTFLALFRRYQIPDVDEF